MPDRAARLARLGTRLVSALAGLLMLALLAFGGFALWQDAALRRGAFVGAELLQYKPAAPAADNPTLAAMFGDVARFAEADYFAAHPAGSISLPDAAYTIELFACVVTDAYDIAIYTPERYHDDVGALLDYAAAQAVQQRDIGVTAQDRLVALSTCAGSETNGRVVVLGRLCPLKEGDEMQ